MSIIHVHVGSEIIDTHAWLARTTADECGAQVVFQGIVRNRNHGKSVVAVAYDAFEPLAEQTLRAIIHEAEVRWGEDLRATVIHRTGELKVGESSVLVIVSTCHRAEAYEVSRYIMEELKIRAPIWKKEIYDDGETEWLKGHALCGHSTQRTHHAGVSLT